MWYCCTNSIHCQRVLQARYTAPTTIAAINTSALASSLLAALLEPAALMPEREVVVCAVAAGSRSVLAGSEAVTKTRWVDVERLAVVDEVGVPSTTVTTTLEAVTTCIEREAESSTPSESVVSPAAVGVSSDSLLEVLAAGDDVEDVDGVSSSSASSEEAVLALSVSVEEEEASPEEPESAESSPPSVLPASGSPVTVGESAVFVILGFVRVIVAWLLDSGLRAGACMLFPRQELLFAISRLLLCTYGIGRETRSHRSSVTALECASPAWERLSASRARRRHRRFRVSERLPRGAFEGLRVGRGERRASIFIVVARRQWCARCGQADACRGGERGGRRDTVV